MNVYEELYLPVEELPPEGDWTLYSGNNTHNSWRRPGPVLVALEALLTWGCEHTSPRDANSPHELLVAAREAVDAAKLDALGEPPATDLCVVCRGSAEWRATVSCGRALCPHEKR